MTAVKGFFFFFILSFFAISGCNFLRGEESSVLEEETYEDQESEEEDYAAGEEEYEEESYSMEEEEEESYSIAEEEEEKEEEGGFFSWLFGSSKEKEEEEEDFTAHEESAEHDETYEDHQEEIVSIEEDPSFAQSSPPVQETAQETAEAEPPAKKTPRPISQESPKPPSASLNKIAKTPYKKAGHLVNAVYIARPNDTIESISQKIYGSDQVASLREINPRFQSRSVKVGDKIYYNSPHRRQDSSQLLFYYEDAKIPSSVYALSPGDNIRKTAFELLGHKNSWKEIWATNPDLKSKGAIAKNLNIVYWTKEAQNSPSPQHQEPAFETQIAEGQVEQRDKASEEGSFPPLPLMEEPANQKAIKPKKNGLFQALWDQKAFIILLFGAVFILLLMVRLIAKKRNQRDFDYTSTNIEI